MLIIRHLRGPLAGKEERLDPALDRITFGRNLDCQIQYPAEETVVAHEHFALVRKPPGRYGHWSIETFGDPFVALDGVPVDSGQKLVPNSTFELGERGIGPSFKVTVEPDPSPDNSLKTVAQEEAKAARAVATEAERAAWLARRVAFAGVVLAAFAVVAGGAYFSVESRLRMGTAVREQLVRSAFLVDSPVGRGTAWPVGPHLLATNSHVAEMFDELKPGQKMIVRAPGRNGKVYDAVGKTMHPGFRALTAFLRADALRQFAAKLFVPGYNVALLEIKETLPADTILELASPEELRALKPGSVVATAGYPMEGVIGSPAQSYGATPEFHVGSVTGLTDFFFLPADFDHDHLVHHDLPSAGGASGSPIVDTSGHVVALLSAGNNYKPGPNKERVSSGVLINYGQRVDLLRALMTGDAERQVADQQKYWLQQIATFESGPDIVAGYVASEIRDADKNRDIDLVRVSSVDSTLSEHTRAPRDPGNFQRQESHDVPVSAGADYVLTAYAYDGSELQVWVYAGEQLAGSNTQSTYWPWVRYKVPTDGKLAVWVISLRDRDVKYNLQVHKIEPRRKSG